MATMLLYCLLSLIALGTWRLLNIGRRESHLPPGPATVPIFGNALQIPMTGLGKKFHEWAKQYGSIYSLKVFGSTMIVLAEPEAAYHLLEKKGSIYSDRPFLAIANFVTRGHHVTFEQSTPQWREKRSILTRNLNPQNLDRKFFRIQEAESIVLVHNILRHPGRIYDYTKLYASSVAATISWGHRAKDFDSFFYKDFYSFVDEFLHTIEPGANPPIEQAPWLWYLPGAWKSRAYDIRDKMDKIWDTARKFVDDRQRDGDVRDSIIDEKLQEFGTKGFPVSQHAFNNLFGELLEAGADTTANMLLTIILALTKFPEVQARARQELDAVCGVDRTPQFSDFDQLPYINCIIKEALRWRPTSELGIPHRLSQDDWYNGMFFPKNSTVWLAAWSIHQNADIYPEPDRFNPDRFRNHTKLANEYAVSSEWKNRDKFSSLARDRMKLSPISHHFGYGAGRRMCPGIHLAERSMWRVTAKLLWAFEFEELPDRPLDVNAYTSSNLVRPVEYEVAVKPRSKRHQEVIQRELTGALEFLSQYE